jgi:hypothetical protein
VNFAVVIERAHTIAGAFLFTWTYKFAGNAIGGLDEN